MASGVSEGNPYPRAMSSEVKGTAVVGGLEPEASSAPALSLNLANKLSSSLLSVDSSCDPTADTAFKDSRVPDKFICGNLRTSLKEAEVPSRVCGGRLVTACDVGETSFSGANSVTGGGVDTGGALGTSLFLENSLPLVGDRLVLASLYLVPKRL